MTRNDIRLVRQSFRHLDPVKNLAAEVFYARLFEIDPTTPALFANTDMKVQGAKMMTALTLVVDALDRLPSVTPEIAELARRHKGYGVTERQYASVGAALMWTLEQAFGSAFTPPVAAAWGRAFAALSKTMIQAARLSE
jgi:nitric oxide dioxygenase